ncbi:MAG: di-trans,poly-cis-decaprenylcistransferase [Candidatus Nomurabacteria bacterium]|jgi:undecaprenyl diphosphate synthase|nr:di-trans,poly-cis-decaprenylcistransferase [Candidatus Nomurabacteria bacterium]
MVEQAPTHVGFIVDGNRRWAKLNGVSKDVHRKGKDVVFDVAVRCFERGIKYATFYIFSSENWQRSKVEVSYLMKLFATALVDDIHILHENKIKLVFLGRDDHVDSETLRTMREVEEATKDYTGGTACLCFNYGGQQEIADAARKMIASGVAADEVTPELIGQNIYHPEIPPVDMVVRTGGELRISNFMLWRIAYSEFMFLDKLWPEMTPGDVDAVVDEYNRRSRRFGR